MGHSHTCKADDTVEAAGVIERRRDPELAAAAQASADPIARARFYAEAGLWTETVSTLRRYREAYPTAWQSLLESVGLGALATAPLVAQ